MNKEIAIKVEGVSKTFKIPHEKITSLRGAAVSVFKKNTYEEFKALDDVSFEVRKGEFFGIIGRNGSGKSTLLKILAGIYQPDKGKAIINGRISPFLELGIGFNPELSGRDNIYLNATVLGLSKKEIDQKFDSIVKFSELERFIDQKLKNYSSGMQVRLAFSVSIHANREILLMDEVLAVGDANFQNKCLTEFNRYKEKGKTVILVTHDIATVQRYCDRVMLIRNGKIEKIGDPEEVGSEYIYQNVSDETTRLVREDKNEKTTVTEQPKHEDGKDIIAKITKVDFFDADNNKKNIFTTGDDIRVRIFYETNEHIENPVFGIALYTDDDIHITGPNTEDANLFPEGINGAGFVDFNIGNNPFFSGNFYVTASMYQVKPQSINFDYKSKISFFKIFSSEKNQRGIFKLKHEWKGN